MTDDSLKSRLLALTPVDQRSVFERVAAVYPEIKAAIDADVSRDQIVEALKAEGIEITKKTLGVYLLRLHAKHEAKKQSAARRGLAPPTEAGRPSDEDIGKEGDDTPAGGDEPEVAPIRQPKDQAR